VIARRTCDDRLFVKPTPGGRTFTGEPVQAPPYPGGKPAFLIDDCVDDRAWLTGLIEVTARELPAPKAKRRKPRNQSSNAPSLMPEWRPQSKSSHSVAV
jgi:hypothetical protein